MAVISRRQFVRASGIGVAGVAAQAVLAACGGSSTTTTAHSTASGGKAGKGGTLTIGLTGGSSRDSLNPLTPAARTDYARIYNLFDPLVRMTPDAQPQLYLADEITPNHDGTEWTVRLRRGVTFHDGKDLTAADLIYTIHQQLNPKSPGPAAAAFATLDARAMKQLDRHTVRLPFTRPFATLLQVLSTGLTPFIMPQGFNPQKPVGTGPFQLKSFQPGVQSTFTKNTSYWLEGKPHADTLVILDSSDETSQINALISGQVNAIGGVSTAAIPQLKSAGKEVLVSKSGGYSPFTMRCDTEPFTDVRVRQAFRLVIDRQQMLNSVFGGQGTIGNDVFGIWAPEYDHSLAQRAQDIDQAKSLLKAAGHSNLSVDLVTGQIAEGTVNMAQVFAEQASKAGINVRVRQTTDFYGPEYLKYVFGQDQWAYNYYLPAVADSGLPNSPENAPHFNDPAYVKLYNEAIATLDQAKRTEIAHEMQQIDYNQGGNIIPFFYPVIDAHDTAVGGMVPARSGLPFASWDFKSLSVAA